MAETITAIIDIDVDLDSGAKPVPLSMQLVYGNQRAHTFRVRAYREGKQVYMSGVQAIGYVRRADGTTIELTGVVSLDMVEVTLTEACYAVTGLATISIDLVIGNVIATCMVATAQVDNVKSDYAVSPGSGGGTVVVTGAVRYDITQVLTEDQKARARANIGAGTGSESGGSIAGAVRFDIAQGLDDDQKAQARANIGVTSTGADISGIIDDDTSNSTGSSEKVWSSSKSQYNHNSQGILINSINTRVGTGNLAIGDNVIDAINKVNAKVGSGTGGSSGGTVLTYGNCIGDSLMEGAGTKDADGDGAADYDTHSVPALLAAKTGLTMRNYGVGEEMVATIVGRQGGMPMILKPIDLNGTMRYPTIPANAVGVSISAIHFSSLAGESVTPLLKTSRMAVVGDGDINPCTIAGVEGTLTYDKATSVYTFTRTSTGGAAVPLKAPTIIRTKQMKDAGEGQFLLIWMGQNNTTDTTLNDDADAFADYLIERCKNAIDYAKTDKYIILGSPLANGYANATATAYKPIYSRMQSEFGMHYINIVDYLITYAMDEYNLQKKDTSIGMTSTSDEADIAMYRIPTSLRAVKKDTSGTITGPDYVHLNGTGYSIVADQVYKRGQLLGYWT